MSTADKRNAYRIRTEISQVIFNEFLRQQRNGVFKDSTFGLFGQPMLSNVANIATRAIMNDSHLNVVLKKG